MYVESQGRVPNVELYEEIKHLASEVYQIGDCLAPRTIEEATFEGFMTSLQIGVQGKTAVEVWK